VAYLNPSIVKIVYKEYKSKNLITPSQPPDAIMLVSISAKLLTGAVWPYNLIFSSLSM
jgi:hypothetical protein